MPTNSRRFQESITRELEIIKDRVRDLIGDRHWGEEGRFKEAVLKNILRKFLPNNISVGTGFIVDSNNGNDISRQLDIILYDNTCPVLFSEGDFIITTKKNVKGIIEVKSRITTTSLRGVIQQFDESIEMLLPLNMYRHTIFRRERDYQTRIFLGIFAFEFDGNIDSERIDNALTGSRGLVNHISLGTNLFIRRWRRGDAERLEPPVNSQTDFYNIYDINNLSFSYFISNLIDIVSGGLSDRYWFSFPIPGTKELHRLRTISLPPN
ncbi:MAG: DUF6602 domain-containing protein [Flavisolibacter sp.]